MNKTVMFANVKRNYMLLAIFAVVLCFYLVVIVSIVDVDDMQSLKDLFAVAGGFLDAFGMDLEAMTSVLSYTASTFFSILVMAFSMVYYIIAVNRLISQPIQNGSLAYTLSMPLSRVKYMVTQIAYLLLSQLLLFVLVFVVGLCSMLAKDSIDVLAYLDLVSIVMLLNMALAVLVVLISVCCATSARWQWMPTAVPVSLLVCNIIGGAGGDKWAWLSDISPFGWIDPVAVVTSGSDWWMYLVLLLFVVLGSVASILLFKNKKLPL